jgi:hypothetical protein
VSPAAASSSASCAVTPLRAASRAAAILPNVKTGCTALRLPPPRTPEKRRAKPSGSVRVQVSSRHSMSGLGATNAVADSLGSRAASASSTRARAAAVSPAAMRARGPSWARAST